MNAVHSLCLAGVSVGLACQSLKVSRASYYRFVSPRPRPASGNRRPSHRALWETEREAVLDVLHSERFVDSPPAQVHATLLEEGVYLCSVRTMYRVLQSRNEVHERRAIRTHPRHKVPTLKATGPNQIWSWDITRLKGPTPWNAFHLYVILDMFSRHVVGWMVADREDSILAHRLISTTCERQNIQRHNLTLHSDRGPSMTSHTVIDLLRQLDISVSLSRPRVSNDNAFSESHFKTMKYRPEFPNRFRGLEHARDFLNHFFDWYANTHKHSGIAMLSPSDVHDGKAETILAQRQKTLDDAYARHPERFSKPPKTMQLPEIVELNPPLDSENVE